jgi:hypothetical protein
MNGVVGSETMQLTSIEMRYAVSDQATTMNVDIFNLDAEQGVTSKTKQGVPMISWIDARGQM